MKKIISTILSLIMIVSSITAFAETGTLTGGGSSGGSGGGSSVVGGGGITVIQPVQTPKAEYTVSGTISLPAGMVAPEGGLKFKRSIKCFFIIFGRLC